MPDFSLIDKLKILTGIIVSSPFYISLTIIIIIILIILMLSTIFNKKINKWIFISIWGLFLVCIAIFYHTFILELVDNLFDTIFMSLYFPNLSTYIIIVLISNFFFIFSILNKNIKKVYKIINISNTVIVDLFLIFIIGVVTKYQINVYDELTVFSNSSLLVLLELNSAFFASWGILNLFITYYFRLKKYDKNVTIKVIDMPEIIFDWKK